MTRNVKDTESSDGLDIPFHFIYRQSTTSRCVSYFYAHLNSLGNKVAYYRDLIGKNKNLTYVGGVLTDSDDERMKNFFRMMFA